MTDRRPPTRISTLVQYFVAHDYNERQSFIQVYVDLSGPNCVISYIPDALWSGYQPAHGWPVYPFVTITITISKD